MLFLTTSGPLWLIACSALPCPPYHTLINPLWLGLQRSAEITAAILACFCSSHWWTVWSPGSRSPEWASRQFTGEGKTFNCLFLDLDVIIQSSYFVASFFFFFWSVCRRVPLHEDGGWRSEDNFEDLLLSFHCMNCQAYVVILMASLAISLAFFVFWKPTMCTTSYFAWFFR